MTRLAATAVFIGSSVAMTHLPASAQLIHGVAVGETTSESALLWARSLALGDLRFEISEDSSFSSMLGSSTVSNTVIDKAAPKLMQGLTAGTRYHYRVVDASGDSATGTFKTPHVTGRAGFRMGVAGDWRGELVPVISLRNASARALDMFMCLGDTIYADVASPAVPLSQAQTLADFRTKHAEALTQRFGVNAMRDLRQSTSVFAMIDDHEVTNDFAGGAPAGSDPRFGPAPSGFLNSSDLYRNGLQAFQEYHPIDPQVWSGTSQVRMEGLPKLYRTRRFGSDAQFFAVDPRSFRDAGLTPANPADPSGWPAFIASTFTPGRTMLGTPQLAQLKADLLAAQDEGVTWKFVMVSEPVQNLGILQASDRFEGYAAERADLLHFIKTSGIRNVVFISADIHGTLVNNLTYNLAPFTPQISSGAWEITTGSGAYAAPFGPTVAGIAASLGLPGTIPLGTYLSLPAAQQEAYLQGLINAQITPLGYDPLGLQGSDIPFTQLVGGPTVTNSFGWTEFDVDALTQRLTVTTWATPWYDEAMLLAAPGAITSLQPQVVQQFTVDAHLLTCAGDLDRSGEVDAGDIGLVLFEFGPCTSCAADLDGNGVVGAADIGVLLTLFGPCDRGG